MKKLAYVPRKCPLCGNKNRYQFPSNAMRLFRWECNQEVYWNHHVNSWVLNEDTSFGGLCQSVAVTVQP